MQRSFLVTLFAITLSALVACDGGGSDDPKAQGDKTGGGKDGANAKQVDPEGAKQAYEAALQLRDDDQRDEAYNKLDEAIELDPSLVKALVARGRMLLEDGDAKGLDDIDAALLAKKGLSSVDRAEALQGRASFLERRHAATGDATDLEQAQADVAQANRLLGRTEKVDTPETQVLQNALQKAVDLDKGLRP